MKKLITTILFFLFVTSNQSVFAGDTKKKNSNTEKKGALGTESISLTESLGFTPPYVPVLLPPEVKKVWIPAHVSEIDKNVMVGGHWIFIKISEEKWFIETEEQYKINVPVVIPKEDTKK